MATVSELLRVLQAAPGEAHHGRLCVVEGGALIVQTVGADGVLDHVELLQLDGHFVRGLKGSHKYHL